ncbi:MAG: hypothetical protein ACT4N4_00140 [Rhodospirillales bacterium]
MPLKDRDGLIALLHKLGHPEDKDALAAAREIAHRVKEAGADWAALLAPTGVVHAQMHDDESGHADAGDEGAAEIAPGDTAADRTIIDRLLSQHRLSDDTREMLEDMKQDIKEGEFSAADRRYLAGLEARLAGGKKK